MENQRQFPRVDCDRGVWMDLNEGAVYARLRNASLGGLFVETIAPFSTGTKIHVSFRVNATDKVEADAEVVWARIAGAGQSGMGIRFEPSTLCGKEALESLLSTGACA